MLELRGVRLRSWGSFVAVSVPYIEDTGSNSGASCAAPAAAYSTMYRYRHGNAWWRPPVGKCEVCQRHFAVLGEWLCVVCRACAAYYCSDCCCRRGYQDGPTYNPRTESPQRGADSAIKTSRGYKIS